MVREMYDTSKRAKTSGTFSTRVLASHWRQRIVLVYVHRMNRLKSNTKIHVLKQRLI